jgi:hypothetical protein
VERKRENKEKKAGLGCCGRGWAGLGLRRRCTRAPGWLGRTRPLGPVSPIPFFSFLFSVFHFFHIFCKTDPKHFKPICKFF